MMAGSNVVSLSGGKDSTAMLLMMLERNEDIADIVFFDTGWEFPQMYEHLEMLEAYIGRKITRLQARLPLYTQTEKLPFDWLFSERPVKQRKTGEIYQTGFAWPNSLVRWCTGRKQFALTSYINSLTHKQQMILPLSNCIAFAFDEKQRVKAENNRCKFFVSRFPLIEWGITENTALNYCLKHGFNWGGLYNYFQRVSCFCCPLKSLPELRTLRSKFPDLWKKMLLMESWLPAGKRRQFKNTTVSGLDARFAAEEA